MLIEPKHAWDLTSIVLPPGLLWNCALLNTATGTKEDASEFRIQILHQKKWQSTKGFVSLLQLWAFPVEYSDNSISFIQANSFIFKVKWKIQDEM